MQANYKLSPSDFRYLWNDCKHCYYNQVKNGIAVPKGAFPGIFTAMNGLLQNSIVGTNLQEIHPDLPNAVVEKTEGFLKSNPVTGAESCYISGRYDIVCRLEDDSLIVIDFKITNPKEDRLAGYATQLHAYKYALENPADPTVTPEKVSQIGLVTISPDDVKLHKGKIVFVASPVWHKINVDMGSFHSFIKEISNVLDGPEPEPNASCKYCQYRQQTV